MTTIHNRILLLNDSSQNKIKSSVQILSLNEVVLELVQNALDAQADHIKVVLNYAHGFCSVVDNGHGILAKEFEHNGGLARPFYTSKRDQNITTYGRHGRYLAVLSGLSLLSIASRVSGGDTHVLWLDDSGRLRHAVESADSLELETGTRVKVYGLFSKLPVRSKILASRFASLPETQKEFSRLKYTLLGLVLAASRSFGLMIEHSSPKLIYQHKTSIDHTASPKSLPVRSARFVTSALRQAGLVDVSEACDWQHASIHAGHLQIRGYISKVPVPHRSIQFLALNQFPLVKQRYPHLFHHINELFEKSSFENFTGSDSQNTVGTKRRQARAPTKGIDRWPMFVIWIGTTTDSVQELLQSSVDGAQAQNLLTQISDLLRTLVEEVLAARTSSLSKTGRKLRSSRPSGETIGDHIAPGARKLQASTESFRHWSRVKSSRERVLDKFLEGLPFHEKPTANSSPHPISEDIDFLSHSPVDAITPEVSSDAATSVLASNRAQSDESNCILWKDPQTGCDLRLDVRTGMVLLDNPARLMETITDENHHFPVTTASPSATIQTRKLERVTRPECSSSQVVQNLKSYYVGLAPKLDRPIRSVTLANDSVEDMENDIRTSTRYNGFWAHTHEHDYYSMQPQNRTISRRALQSLSILGQVDRKFVLALAFEQMSSQAIDQEVSGQLVLIDQHAADERCKVEALFKSLHNGEAQTLASPIVFEVTKREARLLDDAKAYFTQWSIVYEVQGSRSSGEEDIGRSSRQVAVTKLPTAIAERCRLCPKLLIGLLREEIWSEERGHMSNIDGSISSQTAEAGQGMRLGSQEQCEPLFGASLPPQLLEMINSRACRSAIMFNDKLDMEQCKGLIGQLSACTLPFQCAHGRPSMVVLASLDCLPRNDALAPRTQPYTGQIPMTKRNSLCEKTHRASRMAAEASDSNDIDPAGHRLSVHASALVHNTSRFISGLTNGLNTIDNEHAMTFGQAYRTWMRSEQN